MSGPRLCDHDEAIDRHAFFAAHRRVGEMRDGKAGGAKCFANISFRVGVAQRRQQFHAVPCVPLDREGHDACGREHLGNRCDGGREVIEIDEHVSRQHEVVFSPARRLVGQKCFELAGDEAS